MIKKEKESRDIKEKGFIQKEAFDIKKKEWIRKGWIKNLNPHTRKYRCRFKATGTENQK
jgi:predicted membrane protein